MSKLIKLAIAVDILFASFLWDKPDVTISSLCGLALRANPKVRTFNGYLGRILNKIQPNHCELAIQFDIQRAQDILKVLQ